jgi:hypothetical protein
MEINISGEPPHTWGPRIISIHRRSTKSFSVATSMSIKSVPLREPAQSGIQELDLRPRRIEESNNPLATNCLFDAVVAAKLVSTSAEHCSALEISPYPLSLLKAAKAGKTHYPRSAFARVQRPVSFALFGSVPAPVPRPSTLRLNSSRSSFSRVLFDSASRSLPLQILSLQTDGE